jgi:hypothetical protein
MSYKGQVRRSMRLIRVREVERKRQKGQTIPSKRWTGPYSLVYRLQRPRYTQIILQLHRYDLIRERFEEARESMIR